MDVLEDLLQRHGLALPLTSNANDISRSIPPASTGTDTVLPPNLTGSGWRESPSRPASRTLPPRSAHERQSSLARSPAQQLPPPGPVGSSSYSALQWSPPPHMSPPSLQHDGTVPNAANPNESATAHIELSPSNPTERSPQEQSFGTLVISHSGRSKYLGPSAASEWLKDVCPSLPLRADGDYSRRSTGRGSPQASLVLPRLNVSIIDLQLLRGREVPVSLWSFPSRGSLHWRRPRRS